MYQRQNMLLGMKGTLWCISYSTCLLCPTVYSARTVTYVLSEISSELNGCWATVFIPLG